ncbi:MAG: hypothetical protein NC313_15825 [Butyrivibrio sp.]|nr:hypothetical protein [Butyrivibrio sp.]
MVRTFQVHNVRKCKEITGRLWEFEACQGEFKGMKYQVATPSCWENYPDFTGYRGEGIYRIVFCVGGNIRLEFKGISHTATVFLDGEKIAEHYNAYTAFDVIVRNLENKEHLLEIKADNRFSQESALHIPNDYMSYGGVSRPVVLEEIGNVYIKQIHITTVKKSSDYMKWGALAEIVLENITDGAQEASLELELAGKKISLGSFIVAGNSTQVLKHEELFDDVTAWTQENPALYTAKAVLYQEGNAVDDLLDRFGFRMIEVDGKSILLNGKKIYIKGFCYHEDHPQFGCALPFAAIAADIETMKCLGANSIRAVHYPHDEIFLDLCDEQGILVWEENHARGLSLEDMENPNFEFQAEQVIREMITAHYNHPSIYIWGILNECASDSEYGKECYEKQFSLINELDTSRPRSFASCKFKTDICFGIPEIVSYNIYPLWYHDTPPSEYLDDLYQWIQQETDGKGKPFLVTEIGAGAIYGFRAPHKPKWSEEYQVAALMEQITAVLDNKDCSGVYIWQFCDVRISEEWFSNRPRTMNNKGIVDEYRRRKLSYESVRDLFYRHISSF